MPREITLKVAFDRDLTEEQARTAADVFAAQLGDVLTGKKPAAYRDEAGAWGYGRAMVEKVEVA